MPQDDPRIAAEIARMAEREAEAKAKIAKADAESAAAAKDKLRYEGTSLGNRLSGLGISRDDYVLQQKITREKEAQKKIDDKADAAKKKAQDAEKKKDDEIAAGKKNAQDANDAAWKKLRTLQVSEITNKDKVTKLTDNQRNLDKDITKSMFTRLGSLAKGDIFEALKTKSLHAQLSTSKQLATAGVDLSKTLEKEGALGDISVEGRGKLLDLTEDLTTGKITEASFQTKLNELSEKDRAILGKKNKGQKSGLDLFKGLKKLSEDDADAKEKSEKAEKRINTARGVGVSIFGALVKLATQFGGVIDKIGSEFGSLTQMGPKFQGDLLDSSIAAQKLGFGLEDVVSVTSTLSSEFGINIDKINEIGEGGRRLSERVLDTAKATGLSNDEAAKLFGTFMQIGGLSAKQAEDLAEGAFQLARQAGVAPQAVMKDIAGSADEIARFTQDGGNNIAEAAVQARQMGLSLSTTAKIAEGLLDFESSLAGEIEASVLIGRQLNFQKARELALSGDIAGATKDIVKQLGSEAEFNALNIIQRDALAKSIGVSVTELSKMVGQADKLTMAGALAAGSFDDLTGQEALSNLSKITNEFKAMMSEALILIGPHIEEMIGGVRDFINESGGVQIIKDTFLGIVHGIGGLIQALPKIIGLFMALRGVTMSVAIAQSVLAVAASSAAIAKAAGAHPWLLGAGAAIAGAAIIGAWMKISSIGKSMAVKDFSSRPGGITHMMGPAGSFALDARDSVLATTNPINVNEVISAPAGAINATIGDSMRTASPNVSETTKETISAVKETTVAITEDNNRVEQRHKESMKLMTQGFKNLTAATLAPMPLRFAMMNGDILAKAADRIGGRLSPYG